MSFDLKDKQLITTKALPNGAATIYSDGLDTGANTGKGKNVAEYEFLLEAPALVVGDLGNGATMKYSVQTDNDAAFGSPTDLMTDILVQTGAGGVGAAAASKRFRLPTDCERYVRIKAVNSAAGDASDKSLTFSMCF